MDKIFTSNPFKLLILTILTILVFEIVKTTLKVDNLLYIELSKNLTQFQINDFFNKQLKFKWFGYLFVPIFILVKTSIIASVVYIGTFFFSKNDVTYKNIWSCVVQAEFTFLLVPILKIAWFYFFQTNYTLEDIQYFYPLSALNIAGYQGLDPWLIYPLQVFNLFELVYIIYLSYQIGQITKTNTDNGLKIVGYSYVPALFLWVTVVMFFTLNYS